MVHKRIIILLSIFYLTGCMYPSENLSQNQISNDAQLQMVQLAIDQYQEQKNGLLPILTKESDTPLYQKYLIDFSLLKQQGLIQAVPGTAFENGGSYQYVLVDVEENPTVKVIDLHLSDEIRSIQQRLSIYRSEHTYPPFGEQVEKNIFELDIEELNLEGPPQVNSPYSENKLPVYIDTNGELLIDYRIELYKKLKELDHQYENGDDIRPILFKDHPVVPAYSIPFTIKDNEPVFAPDIEEEW
ncbi:ABC transporter periplasmic binding protein yphF [Gracilibacillus boraciitolerans JCM 21714]|uniref:ABC transporter periplasmic binding protein yphF n=1 Tax=Gracilibacillus boraciitolerans JCM 21714 TaxID=1298598 RepID=W4VDR3_9BACI|nr:ABC transporter periplasmic binding protein yphF [Gracilibacillus boraciitolerans JCM 21714]